MQYMPPCNHVDLHNVVDRLAICQCACFYHLRRLRQLKRHVSQDTLRQLVSAFILNRLDYCNSLLYGLPWSTIAPLQRVQNAAARLVLGLSPRETANTAIK